MLERFLAESRKSVECANFVAAVLIKFLQKTTDEGIDEKKENTRDEWKKHLIGVYQGVRLALGFGRRL